MSDLRERFRQLDELEAPELRERVPNLPPAGRKPLGRRAFEATIALLIAAVPLIVLVGIFGRSTSTPSNGAALQGAWVVSTKVEQAYRLAIVNADGTVSDPLNRAMTTEIDPAWSPIGSRIAFSGTPKPNTEPEHIYVTDPAGEYPEQLTSGPYKDWNPAWSPQGTRIAFSRLGVDGHTSIAVVNVATHDVTVLTSAGAQNVDPAWSPDGSRIAFMRNDAGVANIYVMNASDGSNVQQLTDDPEGGDGAPSWSPDGQQIAFSRQQDQNEPGSHIWVMNADGSDARQITSGANFEGSPTWSPDGTWIAYLSAPESVNPSPTPGRIIAFPGYDTRNMNLYVMRPDGSDQRRVTVDAHIGYSPDGAGRFAWDPNMFQPSAGTNAAGQTVGGVTILVSRTGPSGDDALARGPLTTIDGCLAIGSEYVIWPAGYRLTEADGKLWLTDDHGTRVAAIGDQIEMGGASDSLPYAEQGVPGGIPPQCRAEGPDHYWIAGTPSAMSHSAH